MHATGMEYFSSEMALERRRGRLEPVVIDYANDQCDMTLQTLSHCGPPDALVARVASLLAEGASLAKRNGERPVCRRVHFVGND